MEPRATMSPDGCVLLDGALGTLLDRRGEDTTLPLWSARPLERNPDAVGAIHRDYLRSGARVLTACTFRTHERSLAKGGLGGRSEELNRRAIALAREAIRAEGAGGAETPQVAGSLGPLEDCYRPDLVPGPAQLALEHGRQGRSLAAAGADLILVETMNTRREAEAAVAAAVATGLPTWASFVSDGAGRLLGGDPLRDAARAVVDRGARAVLVNCVPATRILGDLRILARAVRVPVGAYANIGHADSSTGWRSNEPGDPEGFAERMLACRAAGASILGGCCGTGPEHIAALARRLGTPRPGWDGEP